MLVLLQVHEHRREPGMIIIRFMGDRDRAQKSRTCTVSNGADDRRVISGTRYDRLAESTWLQSALLPLSYGGFNKSGPLVTGIAQW